MQKVRIAKVEPAVGDNKPTWLTDDKAARMSGFQAGLKDLAPGDLINAELEVKGKYINIISFELLEKAQAREAGHIAPSGMTRAEIDSHINITALQCACNLAAAGKIALDEVLIEADRFGRWLKRIGKPGIPELLPGEIARLESAPKSPDKVSEDKIKNVGDLYTRALKRGVSRRDINEIAGVGNEDELKAKDLDQVWTEAQKRFPVKES